jgi:hypothetical protein
VSEKFRQLQADGRVGASGRAAPSDCLASSPQLSALSYLSLCPSASLVDNFWALDPQYFEITQTAISDKMEQNGTPFCRLTWLVFIVNPRGGEQSMHTKRFHFVARERVSRIATLFQRLALQGLAIATSKNVQTKP